MDTEIIMSCEAYNMVSNKDVVRQWIEATGCGDVVLFRSLMTQDAIVETMGTSVLSGARDLDSVAEFLSQLQKFTLGGIKFTVIEMTAEDDRVSAEFTGQCKLANGASYNNVYHMLFYLRDGRVRLVREYMDTKLVDDIVGPLLAPK